MGPLTAATEPAVWTGPDGDPLPFTTDEEVLDFLSDAKVVSHKKLRTGINRPRKVLLERDGVRAHAIFRTVHQSFPKGGRIQAGGRDEAIFEVAAYRLARLLELDTIPPVVERRLFGKKGSLQLWIENAMTEQKRIEKRLLPENPLVWRHQIDRMRFFDNLLYNDDRNLGNILFDSEWKLWMVDHTRGFRAAPVLFAPATLRRCENRLWQRLQELEPETIRKELRRYLTIEEMKALLRRRELLLGHIEELIAKAGPREVLFSLR